LLTGAVSRLDLITFHDDVFNAENSDHSDGPRLRVILTVKVKLSLCFLFNEAPRHEGGEEVSGQLHVPVALLPGKDPLVPIG